MRAELPAPTCWWSTTAPPTRHGPRARAAGVLVAALPFNQGVGAAQQTGYIYALRGYDICAHLDGDGQHPAAELARRLVKEVEAGKADMVVGSRYRDPDGRGRRLPGERLAAHRQHLFRLIVSLSTRQRFTDTTSGMRAVNRDAMTLFSERYSPEFAEVESVQRAVRAGPAGRGAAGADARAGQGQLVPDPAALGLLHLQDPGGAVGRPVPARVREQR